MIEWRKPAKRQSNQSSMVTVKMFRSLETGACKFKCCLCKRITLSSTVRVPRSPLWLRGTLRAYKSAWKIPHALGSAHFFFHLLFFLHLVSSSPDCLSVERWCLIVCPCLHAMEWFNAHTVHYAIIFSANETSFCHTSFDTRWNAVCSFFVATCCGGKRSAYNV